MRILFTSNLFPSSTEPTRATYNLNLMQGLQNLGHDVKIIAPIAWVPVFDRIFRKKHCPPKNEMVGGFCVTHPRYLYTPGCFIHWHHLFYRWAVTATFRQVVREFDPDFATLGFIFPDVCAIGPICKAIDLPYVVNVNGSDFRIRIQQKKFAPLIREALHKAPAIVCPGKILKKDMIRAGIDPTPIYSFNNGVDGTLFYPHSSARNSRLLFVGNLVGVKAPHRTLEAFSHIAGKYPEVILDVVGNGPLLRELKQWTERNNLGGRIVFHGFQSPEQVADKMRSSRLLCLSSRSEGMPNVVLEALACGTPVVSTGVGEVPVLIENGQNGFVVDPTDNEQTLIKNLADAMAKSLSKTWDAETISRTVAGFSWEAAAQILVDAVH